MDIEDYVRKLKIKNFRGVFMKDELPEFPRDTECSVVNLNNSNQKGSHWVCYYKNYNKCYYFDSYGNVYPPKELVEYLQSDIELNFDQIQYFNDPPFCGHLCLYVLKKLTSGCDFNSIIFELGKKQKKLSTFLIKFFLL